MTYRTYGSAAGFLAAAEPVLREDECVNGLMLGIALRLAEGHSYGDQPPYMAATFTGGEVAALALMTPPHKLQLLLVNEGDRNTVRAIVDDLLTGRWPVPAVLSRENSGLLFAREWCLRTGATHLLGMRQGIYELRHVVVPPVLPPGHFRTAALQDVATIALWAERFHTDCHLLTPSGDSVARAEAKVSSGDLFVWDDGGPRSMAARTRPTANTQAIGFVYTPPEYRNRGYASATVGALSQTILGSGKSFCVLFTDLSNPTSNHVYQRIGYRRVATVVDVEFSEQPSPESR